MPYNGIDEKELLVRAFDMRLAHLWLVFDATEKNSVEHEKVIEELFAIRSYTLKNGIRLSASSICRF